MTDSLKPNRINSAQLPEPLARLSVDQLSISVRSANALRANGILTFGQLVRLSDNDLLGFYAFGRKCLEDVRQAIDEVLSEYGVVLDVSSQAVEQTPESAENWRVMKDGRIVSPGGWIVPSNQDEDLDTSVDVLDLSARPAKVLADLHLFSLRQLLNYSIQKFACAKNIGRKSIAEIGTKLSGYLAGERNIDVVRRDGLLRPTAPQHRGGTKDLAVQMLSRLQERPRNILADRFGLWDGIAETLQDIGDKLGLTRERVRQIEAMAIKRVRRLYGQGVIGEFISQTVRSYLDLNANEKCGVVNEEEAIASLATDCTIEEVGLAIQFFQEIDSPDKNPFAHSLLAVEPGVFCLDQKAGENYREMLHQIKLRLQEREKPMTHGVLLKEIESRTGVLFTPEQFKLAHRVIAISPSLSPLRNGSVALSKWTAFHERGAANLAEAALRILGRPAHIGEIVEKVGTMFGEVGRVSRGTLHNVLITKRDKFVWVGSGTYGLAVWGLKRPPYLKDRLVELLSASSYPLPFWHLEEKVLEVCNCKKSSVRMTLDLNPKLFRRFEGDQYGLQTNYKE